jgi:hypothetical protein
MYLRDAPLRPLHLSSSPLSSATTFLLGLGILFGLGVVIAYWPIFVAAGIAFGAFIAARAAVRRHRRRQCAHAAIAARADFEHAAIMRGDAWQPVRRSGRCRGHTPPCTQDGVILWDLAWTRQRWEGQHENATP